MLWLRSGTFVQEVLGNTGKRGDDKARASEAYDEGDESSDNDFARVARADWTSSDID